MKWEEFYDNIQLSDNAEDLFEHVKLYAEQLGFPYVSYVMCVPALSGVMHWKRFEKLPEGWQQHYKSKKYSEIDPLFQRGTSSIGSLIWTPQLFSEAPQLWEDAQKFGLKIGISQPCWAARGVYGMLTFLRDGPLLSAGEISMLSRQMQIVTNLLHLSMYDHLDISNINQLADINLTAREREILHWTSEGKTAEIIGAILNISTRTVNFHIGNVLTKLVAVNKVQAVAKARTFGLL